MSRHGSVTFLLIALILILGVNAWPAVGDPLPPQIHTVAGGGGCGGGVLATMASGGTCDNVSATSVSIADARSVAALPGGGFLYVDTINDLVREVSPKGIVTTVAGMVDPTTGAPDTSDAPDGTVAVQSGLNGPVAVTPLPGGGFLVTEYNGSVVRMVSPGPPGTATITTIAGVEAPGGSPGYNGASGPATAIKLNYPTDAEVTAGGQVLIADTGNNLIREVSAAVPGATMSTVAGGGTCDDTTTACEGLPAGAVALHDPVSVSPIAGGAGGYLIAEADNSGANAVRRISPAGAFSTVAGVPGQVGGYRGDGGPATAALLNTPEQVVSTPDGGFLIADTHNEVIRQVSAAGAINTVAGNGVATYAGDGGPATAASLENPSGVSLATAALGEFLIADENDGAIREVTVAPTTSIAFGPASQLGSNGWYVSSPVTATVTTTEGAKSACELDPPQAPSVFGEIPPGCPFSGSGGSVTGDGVHTVWAAGANSIGDDENPVSAIVKIDTGTPTVTCENAPSFRFGTGRHKVSATVTDSISGPAAPVVATRVKTTRAGHFTVAVRGTNMAGTEDYAYCPYTVLPLNLKPAPGFGWAVLSGRSSATFRHVELVRVPATAAVNLSCTGGGCPFKTAFNVTGKQCGAKPCVARHRKRGRARTVDLTPLLAGRRLSPRAELMVSVTVPNTVGRVWELTLRGGKRPALKTTCLEPGSTKPGQGCAAPATKK